jgi:hypothetical protein
MEQLGCHWTNFHESWYLSIFRKSIEEMTFIKIWEEWRVLCVKTTIYCVSCYLPQFFFEWELFQSCRENKNTFCVWIPPRQSYRVWDDGGKYGQTSHRWQCNTANARCMCWITKATNTHSECLIIIDFPMQQWLHKRASVLHYTYIASSVIWSQKVIYNAYVIFIVTPCINDIKHFNGQLMHTTLKT